MGFSSIKESNRILCKACETKKFRYIDGECEAEYGTIVCHKKDCSYLNKLLENSVEV